jgi:hypothetical protein
VGSGSEPKLSSGSEHKLGGAGEKKLSRSGDGMGYDGDGRDGRDGDKNWCAEKRAWAEKSRVNDNASKGHTRPPTKLTQHHARNVPPPGHKIMT